MPVQGTWNLFGQNLPDYGFTELLRQLAGKTPSAERATTFNNPAVYQAKGISTAPTGGPIASYNTDMPAPAANPAASYGGGGGVARPAPISGGGGGVDAAGLADLGRRNTIDSYRAQASGLRSSAQGNFDNILKAVNAFRDRSKTLFDNAGQEITNRGADILGSNARSAAELTGETRAKGRAFGLGDSSQFLNQGKLAANLAATQGNTVAKQGEEARANAADFQAHQDQAQNQENDANTYLRGANDRAASIDALGYNAADQQYQSSLNDIVNYQRQLAAINPLNAGGISQFNPDFSGIVNTINGVVGGNGAAPVSGATPQDFANPVNPTDIFALLKKRGLVN